MLPRETTISSTIVSSSTSPPETSGQSHKRKREYVRRAFFIGNEQRFGFGFHAIIKSDAFVLLVYVKKLTSIIYLALFEIYR
ncbi:hypothetical protein C1H46_001644 [Malus baccata]|uniref:Uncharacterized protein n=1 Tax=Malus baccata TaxID=106549 RepID=A0A540NP30_MALBA|nr:hypothetical protein C1H46_001644 [Malus baccata]